MNQESISSELTQKAFSFFFWFSRFEAALKEQGFLKSEQIGAIAEPNWAYFVRVYSTDYILTTSGTKLLKLAPQRQMVGEGKTLTWQPVSLANDGTDLAKVVRMLKTLRNNVFHGGKSFAAGWDQPARTNELLDAGTEELHALAKLASMEPDLWRRY
jgi:hypothetical protein